MKAPSARGLFEATGKTARPSAVRLEDGSYTKVAKRPRKEDGFEPTPREATLAFLIAEQDALEGRVIWECAAGDGAMAKVMIEFGLDVLCTDMVDRGYPLAEAPRSFFDVKLPLAYRIVTNPPYDQSSWGNGKARWITHALQVLNVDYMALLMPLTWPCAAGLSAVWDPDPPARVYVCRWKIDFTGQGNQPANHAWYVWDRERNPASTGTQMLMLDRPKHVGQGILI